MNINNPKHAPVHPAAIEFRLYGKNVKSHRARPASHDTGARHRLPGQLPAPPDYTMTGGVTPKKGAACKRIKSFARDWISVPAYPKPASRADKRAQLAIVKAHPTPCATIRGQRSHGARRRERLVKRGQWVPHLPSKGPGVFHALAMSAASSHTAALLKSVQPAHSPA